MRGLYDFMEEWQQTNDRRLLSVSVQQDGGNYCCIALTNPTEVVITAASGRYVDVVQQTWHGGEKSLALRVYGH
jgi:hypothetical protein